MISDKVIGGSIHQVDQFGRFFENNRPLPPGQYGRPEPHNFNVLLAAKPVGNADRVALNKRRPIVLIGLRI